jgi:hypothetical protein
MESFIREMFQQAPALVGLGFIALSSWLSYVWRRVFSLMRTVVVVLLSIIGILLWWWGVAQAAIIVGG